MTQEQWLIYLWSIYPNGGFTVFWAILLLLWLGYIILVGSNYFMEKDMSGTYFNPKEFTWTILGKWKYIVSSILLVLIFLCNLVPNREYFAYIIATPYIVDSGKSLVESLQDETSKLSKLNKIMDKGLDKILIELDKTEEGE